MWCGLSMLFAWVKTAALRLCDWSKPSRVRLFRCFWETVPRRQTQAPRTPACCFPACLDCPVTSSVTYFSSLRPPHRFQWALMLAYSVVINVAFQSQSRQLEFSNWWLCSILGRPDVIRPCTRDEQDTQTCYSALVTLTLNRWPWYTNLT